MNSNRIDTEKRIQELKEEKPGRLPKSRVNGVLRVMKKMRVMKKDASDEKRCE